MSEVERDSTLNYLDISIHKTVNGLKTSIHRKPTFTDFIIPYMFNHPTHHKYAAVKYLFNRLNSSDLQKTEYQQELNVIHNILYNNSFPIKPQKQTAHTKTWQQITQTSKCKWATFTYVDKEMSYITNVFRRIDLKIAFQTNHTTGNLLRHKPTPDEVSLSGVYKLTCPDCNKAYVRWTGRHFSICYNKHKKAFHYVTHTSSFAQHLHEQAHSFGPIDNIMQVLHHHKKGAHLNTIERFYIHANYVASNNLNDYHSLFPNIIFDTLLKTHRQYPPPPPTPYPPHPESSQGPNVPIHGTTSTKACHP
jgi:hypothetical protein